MEFPALIHLLSIILLLTGIGLAFSEIRLSGWVLAWILLSGALLVQGFRSILSHLVEHGGVDAATYNAANDWMGLGFSLLIVASMYMMRDEFVKHRLADHKLRVVTAAANNAIMMMDNTGGIVYWNEAAQRIFGYSAQEAQGKKLHKLIVPERYRTDFEKGFDAVRSKGQEPVIGKTLELAGLRKDGTEIVTEHSISGVSVDGKWYAICIVRDIAERKRAEAALLESERKLRLIAENATDVIFAYDMDRRLIYVNPAVEELTGYSVAELRERNFVNWSHPEDDAKIKALWEGLFAGKGFSGEEFRIVTKDGQIKWCSSSWGLLYDEGGRQIGVQGRERDITESKRAEEKLRASEERFKAIASHTPDHIFMQDRDLRYQFVLNPQLGLTEADMIGKTDRDILGPEDAEKITTIKRKVLETGEPIQLEASLQTSKGQTEFFEGAYIPKFDSTGKAGGLIGYFRNVTERKRAELALHRSEARYRELFGGIRSGAAVYMAWQNGEDFVFTDLNPAGERLEKITKQEIVGRRVTEVFPEVVELGLLDVFRRVWKTGQPEHHPVSFYHDNRITGWRENYVYRLASGEVVSVYDDVTERKRAEEEIQGLSKFPSENPNPILRIARDGTLLYINEAGRSLLPLWQLQVGQAAPPMLRETVFQSMDNGSTQVLDLEHGERVYSFFVAPIVASGYTNLYGRDITERKQAEQTRHDYARRLQSVSRRLIEVEDATRRKINRELHDRVGASLSALNLNLTILGSQLPQESLRAVGARLEDTQKLLEETTTHVRDLMADLHPPALDDYGLLAALRTYAESLGARLAVPISVHGEDLAPRLPLAAETALFRVAQGALVNAITHAHAKRIEILLAASPNRVALTIADDGAGFDVAQAAQARASWGLAIMRERAEAVGAELSVESTPGKGTRVCVDIPREKR